MAAQNIHAKQIICIFLRHRRLLPSFVGITGNIHDIPMYICMYVLFRNKMRILRAKVHYDIDVVLKLKDIKE